MARKKKQRPRTPGEHWANQDKPIPPDPLPSGWHWRNEGYAVFDPDTCEADNYTAWCQIADACVRIHGDVPVVVVSACIATAVPWDAYTLDDEHVWCPNCRSDLCLVGTQWPDPTEREPGEVVTVWVSCYVEDDDGQVCDEDILVQLTVNAAGDGYEGPPKNVLQIG